MNTTNHDTKTNLLDVIEYCTGVAPPSREAFADLRTLWCTCTELRYVVDRQWSNAGWCALLSTAAAEFCHKLSPGEVLAEGQEPYVHIRELFGLGEYDTLAKCMIEYLPHLETQKSIMRMLRAHLRTGPPEMKPVKRLLRMVSTSNIHYSVAEVMRFHMSDIDMFIDASNVLSDMYDFLQWSPDLVTYIITTTIAMLQRNTHTDTGSAHVCFAGVKLVEKFSCRNTSDVMLHNPDLMNIVCEAMTHEANATNSEMQHNGSLTLHRLLPYANADVIWTTDFVLVEESLLLAAFALRTNKSVLQPLKALYDLNVRFSDIVQERQRTLELCKRTLTSFGADFNIMNATFALLLAILRGLSGDPIDTTTTQIIPEASTLLTSISTVMFARNSCTESKNLCVSALSALYLLCQNQTSNLQCVIDNDVCKLLYLKYHRCDEVQQINDAWQLAFVRFSELVDKGAGV